MCASVGFSVELTAKLIWCIVSGSQKFTLEPNPHRKHTMIINYASLDFPEPDYSQEVEAIRAEWQAEAEAERLANEQITLVEWYQGFSPIIEIPSGQI